MYLEAIVIGLIIGFFRNGRLMNFFEVKFKGWTLSIIALLIFLIPFGIKLFTDSDVETAIYPFVAMVICALIVLFNFEKTGMKILLLGILLNLVVMGLSDFKMPIDTVKMEALGFGSFVESMSEGNVINYVALEQAHPISAYFGKIIALPKVYPLAKLISIGDVIVSIGIAWIIQYEMLLSSVKTRGSMLQFSYKSKFNRR